MKNIELYATAFPENIIKSAQVHEDNIRFRLQRETKYLNDDKNYTKLLKQPRSLDFEAWGGGGGGGGVSPNPNLHNFWAGHCSTPLSGTSIAA